VATKVINLEERDEIKQVEKENETTGKDGNIEIVPTQLISSTIRGTMDMQGNSNIGNNSDDSSNASEYVKATQVDGEQENNSTHASIQIDKTLEWIHMKMDFLNQSWTNLADQEQEELDRRNKGEEEAILKG